MLATMSAALAAAAPALALLALKTTLLFAAAFVVTIALRRATSATRHLVWIGAFSSALVLPVAAAVLPAWHVMPRMIAAAFAATNEPMRIEASAVPLVAETRPAVAGATTIHIGGEDVAVAEPARVTVITAAPQAFEMPAAFVAGMPDDGSWLSRVTDGVGMTTLLMIAWALGALFFLADIVGGARTLARVRRRATPVWGGVWDRALALARDDCERGVLLMLTDELDVPATWGIFSPVIILPSHAAEWSDERLVLVLRHEMAHVARWDVLSQLVARTVTALHWFNPMAWLAERALRRECELACDDAVVANGMRPSRYAEELLDIAGALTAPPLPAMASSFATRSTLEARLRALLDATIDRRGTTAFDAAAAAVLAIGVLVPLAMIHPREASAADIFPGAMPALASAVSLPAIPAVPAMPATPAIPAIPDLPAVPAVPELPQLPDAEQTAALESVLRSAETRATVARLRATLAAVSVARVVCEPGRHSSSSIHSGSTDGVTTWEVHWSGTDCSLDLRAEGKLGFNDEVTDVVSVSDGGWFDLTERTGDDQRRLVIRSKGGSLERRFTVNGEARPWDATAQRWLADVLVRLDRATAFAADSRIPKLLQRGGVNAVLDEVRKMGGDHAASVYLDKLLAVRALSPAEEREVLRIAGEQVTSDYDRANIIVKTLDRNGLPDESAREAYGTAVRQISSDYERNRALHALLGRDDLTTADAAVVLGALAGMSSDYERSRTLVRLTERKKVAAGLVAPYLAAASRIGSDYEQARALVALASAVKLDADQRDAYRATARGIGSEYERNRALGAIAAAER